MENFVQEIGFDQFQIYIGDGADPEVFLPKCLMNAERGLSISPDFTDVVVPSCVSDQIASVVRKFITQVTAEATGSGKLSSNEVEFFMVWAATGVSKNIKIVVVDIEVSFSAKLGPFEPSAPRNDLVTASINLMSDGGFTITNTTTGTVTVVGDTA